MCSSAEMIRSAQLGIFTARQLEPSWVSTGSGTPGSSFLASAADCNGWSNASSGAKGTSWQAPTGVATGTALSCDQSIAVACCR
jgi:hypothetical protein